MLNSPFYPWPYFTEEEAEAVKQVLLSNKVNYWTGHECRNFEKEFAKKLELRTVKFAIEIINLSASLPKTTETLIIRNQLTKSGTSIGANYREANRSRSKKDF